MTKYEAYETKKFLKDSVNMMLDTLLRVLDIYSQDLPQD